MTILKKQEDDSFLADFPRNKTITGTITLILHSDSRLTDVSVTVEDTSDSYDYFTFAFEADLAEGEYIYTILDGEAIVGKGIAVYGDLDEHRTTNNVKYINNNEYIVYGD